MITSYIAKTIQTAYETIKDIANYTSQEMNYASINGETYSQRDISNLNSSLEKVALFAKKEKKKRKGGGTLWRSSKKVHLPNGHFIDLANKPKDVNAIQFIMEKAGINRKQASRALKTHK